MIARLLCSGLLVFAALGCSHDRSSTLQTEPPLVNREGPTEQSRVLAIARRAVEDNDTWSDSAEYESPQKNSDGSWSIIVWRIPKTPGGFRIIDIDRNGKVARYERGH